MCTIEALFEDLEQARQGYSVCVEGGCVTASGVLLGLSLAVTTGTNVAVGFAGFAVFHACLLVGVVRSGLHHREMIGRCERMLDVEGRG